MVYAGGNTRDRAADWFLGIAMVCAVVLQIANCMPVPDGEPSSSSSGSGGNTSPCGPDVAVVSRVIDGDTLELVGGEHLRVLLIDTPEATKTTECGGPEATAQTRELVSPGSEILLTYGPECRDRYGRLLAFVEGPEGSLGETLVARGYACVAYFPPNGADELSTYRALEDHAHSTHSGAWGWCPLMCQ